MSKFLSGLVVGAAFGAAAALLLAPKNGEELREELTDRSEDLKAVALDYLEMLTVKGEEIVSATKEHKDAIIEKLAAAKDEFTSKSPVEEAVETAEETVEEIVVEVEDAVESISEEVVEELQQA